VAALAARTEGWIAGLQVAAMAMQRRDDVSGFIAAFSGGHRYILSYLVEEVLQRQREPVRTFLLQTAILDRLSGSLCDAVTDRSDGQETLEYLEDANLFIVPLDDERRWYRYHRLFGDVLRARLEREFGAREVQTLQRQASDWYDQHGFALQAVNHALEARDHERSVDLIERHVEEIFQRCEFNTLVAWIRALPGELVAERPLLSMIYAWALLNIGHFDEVGACLRNIEQAVGARADALTQSADGAEPPSLTAEALAALVEVTVLRCNLAVLRFDIPLVLELAQRVLPFLEDDTRPYLYNPPSSLRPVVIFYMAVAHEFSAQLSAASQAFAEAAELGREQRNQFIALLAMSRLARLQVLQGQLREAEKTCQQALRWGAEMAGPSSPIVGYARIGLGNLLYERNELDAALAHLQQGIALLKPWHNLEGLVFGYIGLARTKHAQGDWGGAFAAVDELVELCSTPDAQMMSPAVETVRAALWIERGNLDAAGQWAERSGLSADGDLVYVREGETLVFARVLIAQERLDEATRLLTRLLATAQAGGRGGRVIEILALQAVVLKAQGKMVEALAALERALALAEPEGYARVFIDEGEVMAALLSQVDILPAYVRRLLAALEGETQADVDAVRRRTEEEPTLSSGPDQSSLVEPLSERELELLRLIAAGLTNQAIAESLMVSVNTVKTHARNIYGKLGVHNRTQAATRARELGLL
jgi:LuxR family maltose regulon positive regulatory protein